MSYFFLIKFTQIELHTYLHKMIFEQYIVIHLPRCNKLYLQRFSLLYLITSEIIFQTKLILITVIVSNLSLSVDTYEVVYYITKKYHSQ